jgi:hypothetical protein
MHRVLKPGGKAWISDLRGDVSNATIDSFVNDTMRIRGLAGIFMKYTFKHGDRAVHDLFRHQIIPRQLSERRHKFVKGLQVGMLITLVASLMYAVALETYFQTNPEILTSFMDKYADYQIKKMKEFLPG